ncbi:MAG: glycosyltransferase family 2 protein, partial [Cyanobacteriota bacterium]
MDRATLHELILVIVAYHPAASEVSRLHECLSHLPAHIGYAVVVNDYESGEPVELLRHNAVLFLTNKTNPGYGRAVNQAVRMLGDLGCLPAFLGALNTDLAWSLGTFQRILEWLKENDDVVLAVPRLINPRGELQKLCKQNPTILGLLSRRFIPTHLKLPWLHRYDDWFIMADADYNQVMDVPYLSGC